MRGEAVPYHVRRQVVKYANLAAVAGQQFPECLPGHRRPARRHEHESARTALEQSRAPVARSEEHTSELQSQSHISYAVFCLKKKTRQPLFTNTHALEHISKSYS